MSSSTEPAPNHRSTFRQKAVEAFWALHDGMKILPIPPLQRGRRVPVRFQAAGNDCAPACLAMVLGAFGHHVPVATLRESMGAFRDGTSASAITRVAEQYGLRAEGFSTGLDDLRHLPTPAILHWNFKHYVVLEKWTRAGARIVDPAHGRRRVSRAELDRCYTGVALVFDPEAAFRTSESLPSPWRRYIGMAVKARSAMVRIFSLSLVLQVLGLLLPLLTKFVVDWVIPSERLGLLSLFAASAVVVFSVHGLCHWLRGRLVITLQAHLDSTLMTTLCRHLLRLPYAFFQQRSTGDLLMRIGSSAAVRDIMAQQLVTLVLDGGMVIVYLIAMLLTSPLLTGVAVLFGAAQIVLGLSAARVIRRLTDDEIRTQSAAQSFLVELLRGIETVKSSAAEERCFSRWRDLFNGQLAASVQRQKAANLAGAAGLVLTIAAPIALLLVGCHQVLQGSLSLGTVLGFSALAAAFLNPLASIVDSVQRIEVAGVHMHRLDEVFSEETERLGGDGPGLLSGAVRIEGLGFRYSPESPFVLKNVQLEIRPGEFVAIVGPSGSGKSTLMKVLLGLYPPTEGAIYYDEALLDQIDMRALREQIGVVLQGGYVFSDSVRSNVAFGQVDLSPEVISEALAAADLESFLEGLPMGLETRLSEAADNISGGQRQRLSIARALIGRPKLVILDEPTSELDTVSEARIFDRIAAMGITRIVVAHRLTTVKTADRIVVLNKGRIVQAGTHEMLMRSGGLYSQLVESA